MPVDLYNVYKKFVRRSQRDPDNFNKFEMTQLARELVMRQPGRKEMLSIVQQLVDMEGMVLGRQESFAEQMKQRIETNDFVIRAPYRRHSEWNKSEKTKGKLYVLIAWSRPGLSRLGASYFHMDYRIEKDSERFGYPVSVFWETLVEKPFTVKLEMSRKLAELKVPSEFGDSSGWYRIAPGDLKIALENQIAVS